MSSSANQITVTGMVLQTAPVGEYDRRVVILTKEMGKISAFAKGARKPNSPLVAAVNPFAFGEFELYVGRSSYTIRRVRISNYFEDLRKDVEGACYGFYFLEFASFYTREGMDGTEMLKLLYQTARALVSPKIPNRLIRYIFELKALYINGEGPQVYECLCCGKKEGLKMYFSPSKGGLVCPACAGQVPDAMEISHSALYSMQYILSSRIEHLYTFVVTEEVLNELARIMKKYTDLYVDKTFKSLEILETLL